MCGSEECRSCRGRQFAVRAKHAAHLAEIQQCLAGAAAHREAPEPGDSHGAHGSHQPAQLNPLHEQRHLRVEGDIVNVDPIIQPNRQRHPDRADSGGRFHLKLRQPFDPPWLGSRRKRDDSGRRAAGHRGSVKQQDFDLAGLVHRRRTGRFLGRHANRQVVIAGNRQIGERSLTLKADELAPPELRPAHLGQDFPGIHIVSVAC